MQVAATAAGAPEGWPTEDKETDGAHRGHDDACEREGEDGGEVEGEEEGGEADVEGEEEWAIDREKGAAEEE